MSLISSSTSSAPPGKAPSGITRLPVQKITADRLLQTEDPVVVEEPLEIHLQYGPAAARREQSVSVTMRTPGHDAQLATGFLYTEGILPDATVILSITGGDSYTGSSPLPCNRIHIALREEIAVDLGRLQRHFYTSSSCGVCGKTSIEALRTICPPPPATNGAPIEAALLYSLPALLRQGQDIFDSTGGLHAAALFDSSGRMVTIREDIGRHNALDKLIGHALHQGLLPLPDHILLLSGRACFELVQKAAMAGITIIAAIGPPSTGAIQLAEETGITLVGFLREQRFNIYTGAHRIRI